ncbi:MAG: RNA polymerase sigma factor [Pseudomonadota bacterium]
MSDFRVLLERETPILSRYARRLCRGSAWSEDLLQETLLLALRLEKSFTLGTNLRAWLFTLMRNKYRNEVRKRQRRGKITIEEQVNDYITDWSIRQESSLALSQTLDALAVLPKDYRDVLVLVAVKELTYVETADRIGIPIGTVRSRLSRARVLLKSALEEHS